MGWIANILFLLGLVAVGNKCRVGFAMNAVANAIYMLIGVEKGMHDLFAISLCMATLDVCYFHKWGKT